MQFELNQKIGTNYSTVKFIKGIRFKLPVIESFENSFSRIGGKFQDNGIWKFPSFITTQVIQEVIRNTCFECGGLMQDGEALDNTYVSFDDFGGDAGQRGTTQSKIGQPVIKIVRKCTLCGHSHT